MGRAGNCGKSRAGRENGNDCKFEYVKFESGRSVPGKTAEAVPVLFRVTTTSLKRGVNERGEPDFRFLVLFWLANNIFHASSLQRGVGQNLSNRKSTD